jgi:hypothetical protein
MDQVSTVKTGSADSRTRSEIFSQLLGMMPAHQELTRRETSEVHPLKEDGV